MAVARAVVTGALTMVAQMGSIPLREEGIARPPFGAYTLTRTKTRIIPAGQAWIDYVVIQMGEGEAPSGYAARIAGFVASGLLDPATTGIEYRFLINNYQQMSPQEFVLAAGVDLNVDHLAAQPFPSQPRKVMMQLQNDQRLALQVRNTGGVDAVALGAIYGWYYPNLGDMPRDAQESTGFRQDDSASV
jgi:hypothetical protein